MYWSRQYLSRFAACISPFPFGPSNGYLIVEVLDYSVLPCFILNTFPNIRLGQ